MLEVEMNNRTFKNEFKSVPPRMFATWHIKDINNIHSTPDAVTVVSMLTTLWTTEQTHEQHSKLNERQ